MKIWGEINCVSTKNLDWDRQTGGLSCCCPHPQAALRFVTLGFSAGGGAQSTQKAFHLLGSLSLNEASGEASLIPLLLNISLNKFLQNEHPCEETVKPLN